MTLLRMASACPSTCEVLPIDWTSVKRFFDSKDSNASFEGVAVGGDTLYVANERQLGQIITVDGGRSI